MGQENLIEHILDKIIEFEEGFTNHPNDPGGPTKYGITQETGRLHGIRDVSTISKERAKNIYLSYIPKHFLDFNPKFIFLFLQFSILTGQGRALQVLQRLLGLTPDGKSRPGGLTQRAIEKIYKSDEKTIDKFYIDFASAQLEFLENLIKKNPKLQSFEKGWRNRILKTIYFMKEF